MGVTTGVLHAGAVVFRLLTLFALHSQLGALRTIPEVVGVVVRRRFAALGTFETVARAVAARAMA